MIKTTQTVKYRIDHAPADNPNELTNIWLDKIARRHPSIQIEDFQLKYASPYCSYLDVTASFDASKTLLPNRETLHLGDGFYADVYCVYPY